MAISSRSSRIEHLLERAGLATAGASCGLFVAAFVVKEGVPALMSLGFVFAMMVGGAIGFYLGIDLPPRETQAGAPPVTDRVELLSAVGTFLAPVAALIAVIDIILDIEPRPVWVVMIAIGWLVGVVMQIIAGWTARFGR
ncbi:MAG: hypothetical protein P4M07_06220 [Xanthobacteraceae bacterium]|nr:hypothetical protein [Xanthobacteraceae bacterium]